METANVKQNISSLENSIADTQKVLRESKNLAENTRSEIVGMETSISLLTDDTPKAFFPQISEMFKDFQQEVNNQIDANEYFQKQLTELKKESSVIHQKIIASNTKSKILEDAVGIN